MGTDVHSIIEVKKDIVLKVHPEQAVVLDTRTTWTSVENPWEEDRDYLLFAILANVRNGFGFAGTYRHEPIEPITNCRGLPDDFSEPSIAEEWRAYNHSHTWLLGSEFMSWYNSDIISIVHTGIITKQQFESWDGNEPDAYCSDAAGPNIVIGDDINSFVKTNSTQLREDQLLTPISSDCTHVRVWWSDNIQSQISYFYDEVVKPLMDKYGDFRLVMSFDS